jgi:hypothetical protein
MSAQTLAIDPPRTTRERAHPSRHFGPPLHGYSAIFHSPRCLLVVAGIGALLGGCQASRPEAAAASPSREPSSSARSDGAAPRDTLPGEFRTVELRAVPARVSLPAPSSWQASREGSFVILDQRATSSRIVLRVWRAGRLVRPAECEAQARLLRPALPRVDPSSLLDERSIAAPRGYDVRLVVAVEEDRRRAVRGLALAVGAAVGRCYLAAYETWAEGASAPERVADRLATMVPGFIETVEVEGVEGRATRTDASP